MGDKRVRGAVWGQTEYYEGIVWAFGEAVGGL